MMTFKYEPGGMVKVGDQPIIVGGAEKHLCSLRVLDGVFSMHLRNDPILYDVFSRYKSLTDDEKEKPAIKTATESILRATLNRGFYALYLKLYSHQYFTEIDHPQNVRETIKEVINDELTTAINYLKMFEGDYEDTVGGVIQELQTVFKKPYPEIKNSKKKESNNFSSSFRVMEEEGTDTDTESYMDENDM